MPLAWTVDAAGAVVTYTILGKGRGSPYPQANTGIAPDLPETCSTGVRFAFPGDDGVPRQVRWRRMALALPLDSPAGRRSNRTGSLVLASFGALLAFLDVTIVNVAFPSIQTTFSDASISELSWVLNSYNIVFAALLVAAGRLADVYGRRR